MELNPYPIEFEFDVRAINKCQWVSDGNLEKSKYSRTNKLFKLRSDSSLVIGESRQLEVLLNIQLIRV